jgi:RNA polymerase sigma factor (sigma-70 family)
MEAFARFPVFSGHSETEIRSWLTTIVQHNVIDAARHYRIAQRRTHLRELRIDSENGAAEIPSSCPTPSLALRRQEQDVALERALAKLSESQRRVVELRYRDGHDYRQIAETMAISEVAARKLYSRAIEQLRKLLATEDGSTDQSRD